MNINIYKSLNEFDFFHSIFLTFVSKKDTDVKYSKKKTYVNIQENLIRPDTTVAAYSVVDYLPLYDFINNVVYPISNTFFKNYTELTHVVDFMPTKDLHEFAPQTPVLGLKYKILDKNNLAVVKFKFTPYLSKETNKPEINIDFKLLDPQYIMFFRTFFKQLIRLENYKYVNLTNLDIYSYAILNKLIPCGLDDTRKNFKSDLSKLKAYAKQINSLVPLELAFDEKGRIKQRNRSVKLMTLKDLVEFPAITSYVLSN